jgi:hypothetical protein
MSRVNRGDAIDGSHRQSRSNQPGEVEQPSSLAQGVRLRFDGKPAHNIDQLGVRGAGRIAELIDRVSVG